MFDPTLNGIIAQIEAGKIVLPAMQRAVRMEGRPDYSACRQPLAGISNRHCATMENLAYAAISTVSERHPT